MEVSSSASDAGSGLGGGMCNVDAAGIIGKEGGEVVLEDGVTGEGEQELGCYGNRDPG